MARTGWLLWVVWAVGLAAAGVAHAAGELHLVVYPNPGLFEVGADDSLSGKGMTLIQRMGGVSGITLNVQSLPIPRALATGAATPNHCLVGMIRTPEREASFAWVGPVGGGSVVAYVRADDTRPLKDASDLRGRQLVTQRDSAMASALRQQGLAPYEANNPLGALRMLQAGRADVWVASELSAQPTLDTAGGAAVRPALVLQRVEIYLACHLGSEPELLTRLQQAVQRLRRQGELTEFGLR